MLGWLKDHWKSIAVIAAATVVFVGVTALTGGLAAPALAAIGASALATPLSLLAGGFASGAAGYVVGRWLDGEKPTLGETLRSGAIAGVVTLATAGLGRVIAPLLAPTVSRIAPVVAAIPTPVKVSAMNGVTGSAFGAVTQAGANVVTGRPIGENLGDATALGAVNGLLLAPAQRLVPTPRIARGADDPLPGRGVVGALDGPGSKPLARRALAPPLRRQNPLADTRVYLEQSPTLAKGLDVLLRQGWTIRYGAPSRGTFANRSERVIQIARDHATAEDVAQAIAHEVGHALDRRPQPFLGAPSDHGRWNLESEGKAVLFNAQVRNEIFKNTGIDIGVNGDSVGPVSQIANSTLSDAEKIRRIGEIFAKAHPSGTGPHETYEYYYGVKSRTLEQLAGFWKRLTGG